MATTEASLGGGSGQNPWGNGQGYYIYINSKYATETNEKITSGLSKLQAEGAAIRGISSTQEDYRFASGKVRARLPEYPCGNIIGPDFFAEEKMRDTINIIILFVVDTTRRSTKSGSSSLVSQGFAVLRDLNLAAAMASSSATYGGASLKKQLGNYLYIEGVCASSIASQQGGSGTQMMQLVHKLAYYSKFAGTKLASLAYVIPYYFNKFAYRFRDGCGSGRGAAALAAAGTSGGSSGSGGGGTKLKFHDLNVMARNLSRISEDKAKYNAQWRTALGAITDAGFNAEVSSEQHKTLASLRSKVGIWWETDEGSRYLDAWGRIGMQDQGFYMYFCFHTDPTYGVLPDNNRQMPFTKFIINTYRASVGLPPLRDAAAGVAAATKAAVTGGAEKGGGHKRRRKRKTKRRRKRKNRSSKNKRGGMPPEGSEEWVKLHEQQQQQQQVEGGAPGQQQLNNDNIRIPPRHPLVRQHRVRNLLNNDNDFRIDELAENPENDPDEWDLDSDDDNPIPPISQSGAPPRTGGRRRSYRKKRRRKTKKRALKKRHRRRKHRRRTKQHHRRKTRHRRR